MKRIRIIVELDVLLTPRECLGSDVLDPTPEFALELVNDYVKQYGAPRLIEEWNLADALTVTARIDDGTEFEPEGS
jgi:hypothetical protein